MRKSTFATVFNRRGKLDKREQGLIDIYCYVDGEKKYISTGLKVLATEWDEATGRINKNNPSYIQLNYLIDEKIRELNQHEVRTLDRKGTFSMSDIEIQEKKGSFTGWLKTEIESDRSIAHGTLRYRRLMLKKLLDCHGEIQMSGVNYNMIHEFDKHLTKTLGVATTRKHHNQLRKFIQVAVNKEYIKENPYKKFRIKRPPRTLKKCLWYNDIERIWNLKYEGLYELVRLKFLFSCYTGLRISDNKRIRHDDIREGRIFLTMEKTHQPVTVPLNAISERTHEIIELAKEEGRATIFKKVSDTVCNEALKTIGINAQIPFPLNFHVSRHTFCTLVADKTGSVFKVMEYAGIYKVETAMVYVNLAKLFG